MTFEEWFASIQPSDEFCRQNNVMPTVRFAKELMEETWKAATEAERAKQKSLAYDFYIWWHNQPGTNTEEGLEEFMAIRARGKDE